MPLCLCRGVAALGTPAPTPDGSPTRPPAIPTSCRQTATEYGFRGLYTGLGVRVLSRLLYRSAYFVLYDVTQNVLSKDAGQVP